MSKFWGGGSSDESEEELSGGEGEDDGWDDEGGEDNKGGDGAGGEEEEEQVYVPTDSDSDDEDVKRTVKSARRKRYEELFERIETTREHVDAKDFEKLWEDMNALDAWLVKAKSLVQAEGIPGPILEMFVLFEDECSKLASEKEALSALNKTQAKAFNRLRKALPKHNKEYADKLKAYRENPDAFPAPSLIDPKVDWADEMDNEGEGDEVEPDEGSEVPSTQPSDGGDWEKPATRRAKGKAKKAAPAKAAEPKEWTDELVHQHLGDLVKQRGRKKTDKKEQIAALKKLLANSQSTVTKVEVYRQIIAALFEFSSAKANKYMKADVWNSARTTIQSLLALVLSDSAYPAKQEKIVHTLRSFVDQLSAELIKALQNIDPHTHEYVDRLKGETSLLELAAAVQSLAEKLGEWDEVSLLAMKRVEHMYYKDTLSEKLEVAHQERKAAEGDAKEGAEKEGEAKSAAVSSADLDQLCTLIYKHGDKELKLRAMLCQVYHRALHDKYHQARDMILMYHLQDDIHTAEIPTQILFNRTMAQVGLCAFRKGYIAETHSALADISTNKVREFLAQGVLNLRFGEKNPEQEKLERQRQVPYHMHINLDLLEAVHLISAMLLEVPNLASRPFEVKPKYISRAFGRLLMVYERQVFAGPPETTRDFVLTAAKALEKGDWKRCEELLLNLPVWDMMHSVDQVKAMLRSKIQEAGLRTYLFTYGQNYDSLSLEPLCIMFDVPHATAHSIISKMMFNEELHASWDQPTGAIIMHKVEPSRLQFLALQYAEKLAGCVENNERILDARTGSYGFKYEQKQQKDGRGRKNQRYQQQGQNYRDKGEHNREHREHREHREPREHYQNREHNTSTGGSSNTGGHQPQQLSSSGGGAGGHQPRGAWGGQQGAHRSSESSGGGRGGGRGGRGGGAAPSAWGQNARSGALAGSGGRGGQKTRGA